MLLFTLSSFVLYLSSSLCRCSNVHKDSECYVFLSMHVALSLICRAVLRNVAVHYRFIFTITAAMVSVPLVSWLNYANTPNEYTWLIVLYDKFFLGNIFTETMATSNSHSVEKTQFKRIQKIIIVHPLSHYCIW